LFIGPFSPKKLNHSGGGSVFGKKEYFSGSIKAENSHIQRFSKEKPHLLKPRIPNHHTPQNFHKKGHFAVILKSPLPQVTYINTYGPPQWKKPAPFSYFDFAKSLTLQQPKSTVLLFFYSLHKKVSSVHSGRTLTKLGTNTKFFYNTTN